MFGCCNDFGAWLKPSSSDTGHVADNLCRLCGYVASPGSYLFRMDERLVQSQVGLHHDGPRRFCEERRQRQAVVHHVPSGNRDGRPGAFHSTACPGGGQITIDMSLITCKQYSSSDAARREFIASWISGYFRASRSQPVFDFQRFANNKKAVENYCKKRGGETLMSAIQNTAR